MWQIEEFFLADMISELEKIFCKNSNTANKNIANRKAGQPVPILHVDRGNRQQFTIWLGLGQEVFYLAFDGDGKVITSIGTLYGRTSSVTVQSSINSISSKAYSFTDTHPSKASVQLAKKIIA